MFLPETYRRRISISSKVLLGGDGDLGRGGGIGAGARFSKPKFNSILVPIWYRKALIDEAYRDLYVGGG